MAHYHLTSRIEFDKYNANNGSVHSDNKMSPKNLFCFDNTSTKISMCNHPDKTYAGDTWRVFTKEGVGNLAKQYYHGGNWNTYNPEYLKEKKSFNLFYFKNKEEIDSDLFDENSFYVNGIGLIQQNNGAAYKTISRGRKGEIYCYTHFFKEKENTIYTLFRFPFHELLEINKNLGKKFELIKEFKVDDIPINSIYKTK